MPSTEQLIPVWLMLFQQVIVPLSIVTLTAILILQKRRAHQGIRLGTNVKVEFWQTQEVGFVIVLLLCFQLQSIIAGYCLKKFNLLNSDANKTIFTIVVQLLMYGLLFYCVNKLLELFKTSWSEAFGISSRNVFKCLGAAILTLISVAVPIMFTSALCQFLLEQVHYSYHQQAIFDQLLKLHDPLLKAGIILLATVGAPITEEILFRGVIYGWMKKQMGFGPAVILNAAAFALIHFHLPSFLPLMVLAVGFTLLYEWTGSLLSNIFMHAAFNTVSLILFWAKMSMTTSPT